MPIWSQSEDRTTPRYLRETLGGNVVHFATDPNPKGHYRDEDGRPRQDDRAFVAEIPGVPERRFKALIEATLHKGFEAAIQRPGFSNDYEGEESEIGGTTATLALYDPSSFTLQIGSKGDSPAYVILEDEAHTSVIRVTDNSDSVRGYLKNYLNTWHPLTPIREAQHVVSASNTVSGRLTLHKFMRDEHFNPKTTRAHLLVASDGILKPEQNQMSGLMEEAKVLTLYRAARKTGDPNIAQAMAQKVIKGDAAEGIRRGSDNLSLIFIEDIRKGKGVPLAACVCDGFYGKGGDVAENAVRAMSRHLKQEVARAHGNRRIGQPPHRQR